MKKCKVKSRVGVNARAQSSNSAQLGKCMPLAIVQYGASGVAASSGEMHAAVWCALWYYRCSCRQLLASAVSTAAQLSLPLLVSMCVLISGMQCALLVWFRSSFERLPCGAWVCFSSWLQSHLPLQLGPCNTHSFSWRNVFVSVCTSWWVWQWDRPFGPPCIYGVIGPDLIEQIQSPPTVLVQHPTQRGHKLCTRMALISALPHVFGHTSTASTKCPTSLADPVNEFCDASFLQLLVCCSSYCGESVLSVCKQSVRALV